MLGNCREVSHGARRVTKTCCAAAASSSQFRFSSGGSRVQTLMPADETKCGTSPRLLSGLLFLLAVIQAAADILNC